MIHVSLLLLSTKHRNTETHTHRQTDRARGNPFVHHSVRPSVSGPLRLTSYALCLVHHILAVDEVARALHERQQRGDLPGPLGQHGLALAARTEADESVGAVDLHIQRPAAETVTHMSHNSTGTEAETGTHTRDSHTQVQGQ